MVTIKDYLVRTNQAGKAFIALELQGDIELVQSSETGRFYATAKRCTIPSTFNEETAKSIIGTQLPGRVGRVQCEEYNYTVPESGEVIKLVHTYQYVPEESNPEGVVNPRVVLPTMEMH